MKKSAWLILCIITVIAGVALGCTDLLTRDSIEAQTAAALTAARAAVMPEAAEFVEETLSEGSALDSLYRAVKDGQDVGYVGQATVTGYGGPIVVVLGVDLEGTIVNISVGGSEFAETVNLGSRTKDPEFTDRFVGLGATPKMNENVDAISGATVSSGAVVGGAADIYDAISALLAAR